MRVTAEQQRQDSLPEPAWASWESRTGPADWLAVDALEGSQDTN